jgi:uncharacterized protein (TIGR02001 family)
MKKVVIQAAVVGLALFAGQFAAPAKAADNDRLSMTASVGVVSEYFFRGISQSLSDDSIKPAIQPGFEGDMKITDNVTGYLGLWGSNVDFNNGTSAETDFLGGFRFTYDKAALDLGYIYYGYLENHNSSQAYSEVKAVASYDLGFVVPTVGAYYSPNYFGDSGNSLYVTGGVSVPIPGVQFDPKIVANVGHQSIDKNANFGTKDYMDWNVGLFATFFGVTAGLQYVDNNLSKSDSPNTTCTSQGNPCSAAAVVSLSYSYTF